MFGGELEICVEGIVKRLSLTWNSMRRALAMLLL